jgi:hypothetical protein
MRFALANPGTPNSVGGHLALARRSSDPERTTLFDRPLRRTRRVESRAGAVHELRDHPVPPCRSRARISETQTGKPRSSKSKGSSEPPPCDEVEAAGVGAAAVTKATDVLAVAAGGAPAQVME